MKARKPKRVQTEDQRRAAQNAAWVAAMDRYAAYQLNRKEGEL